MKWRALSGIGAGVAIAAAAAVLAYPRYGRDRCLHWGATDDEASGELPGDYLLVAPDILSTRAITIDAPASAVWPWLAQFGPGRGGAYTYDWIENLMGLDIHSTDRILPEYQNPEVGDTFVLGDDGPVVRIASIVPGRSIVFRSDDGNWVWSFTLVERDGRTRLISRNRIASPEAGPVGRAVNAVVMEPGSLVMERKMLLGFKERTERELARAGHPSSDAWGPDSGDY
jgi:hypothetical protein